MVGATITLSAIVETKANLVAITQTITTQNIMTSYSKILLRCFSCHCKVYLYGCIDFRFLSNSSSKLLHYILDNLVFVSPKAKLR